MTLPTGRVKSDNVDPESSATLLTEFLCGKDMMLSGTWMSVKVLYSAVATLSGKYLSL